LIMGIVGGAVLTPLYGILSEAMGNAQLAYVILIPCYLYILYYAMSGYKPSRSAKQAIA
jgi:MFS transporter, FHS family, L-fucose permease